MYEKTRNGGDIVVFLPCSKRRNTGGELAAEAYGTMAANKLRSVLNEGLYKEEVDVYFISAHYGVIPADFEVESYDHELTEENKRDFIQTIGRWLSERDYDLLFSFADGIYQQAIDEVAYKQNTKWEIDTVMLKPCCRSAAMDGIDVLDSVIRRDVKMKGAGEISW